MEEKTVNDIKNIINTIDHEMGYLLHSCVIRTPQEVEDDSGSLTLDLKFDERSFYCADWDRRRDWWTCRGCNTSSKADSFCIQHVVCASKRSERFRSQRNDREYVVC